ncbi:hypothetical protein ACFE04_007335 [Oxalis oulophora]
MVSKAPIFPMAEPQHFSDYGFDPQLDYFQVLEEARKHKRETPSSRSIDSIHFKLQKPISKEDSSKPKKSKKKKWWRNALFFFKSNWIQVKQEEENYNINTNTNTNTNTNDVHLARARAFRASISGPVYITESLSGSSTPYKSRSRPCSGQLNLTSPIKNIPYLSLRELNMEHQQRIITSPIYLVS